MSGFDDDFEDDDEDFVVGGDADPDMDLAEDYIDEEQFDDEDDAKMFSGDEEFDQDDDDDEDEEEFEEIIEEAESEGVLAGGESTVDLSPIRKTLGEWSEKATQHMHTANVSMRALATTMIAKNRVILKSLKHELAAAKDEGDTSKEIEIQEQITALNKETEVAQAELQKMGPEENDRAKVVNLENAIPEDFEKNLKTKALSPAAEEFKKNNPDLFKDEVALGHMMAIDNEMDKDPEAPRKGSVAYMDKLGRKVVEAINGKIPVKISTGTLKRKGGKPARKQAGVTTMGSQRSAAGGKKRRSGNGKPSKKVTLTNADKANMQKWGLNPKDPLARRTWANQKRMRQAEARSR